MIDRIAKLAMLLRLRRRECDRRSRDVAAAARAAAIAEADRARAAQGLADAHAGHARALAQRLEAPADGIVAIYCNMTELACGEAGERLRLADTAVAATQERLVECRRQWMRAQARRDALEALEQRATVAERRRKDRRRTEEKGAPPFAFGLAVA